MTLTIPHHKTQAEVIDLVDRGAEGLFAGAAGPSVEFTDQKKQWDGAVMHFSFHARMGFIALPLNVEIVVGEQDVVVDCVLPPIVNQFVGEDKVGASVQQKFQEMLQ